VPFTREHDRVASSIRSMEAHDLPNRLAEGLRTARALVGTDPRAEIHVFTDGSHPAAARAQGNDVRVRWTGTGRRSHNVGITSLAVRRNYFGTYNSQAFFSVGNFSSEQQNLSLRLTLDDEVLSERTLTLGPQVRRAIVVPFSEQRGGVLKLRLDVSDDLDADNVAYAVIPPPRTISVLLVSPGNLFLEKALQTDPQVKLEVRKPDAYPGGMEGFDVVVVDSVSPQKLGNGRFVLVNTVPSDVPLEVLGRLDSPTIMDWDRTHPIMRQVDLAKVTMEDAMRVRPLAAGKTLVEAVGGPLVYALEERDRLLAHMEGDFDSDRYADVEEFILHNDGYSLEPRAAEILFHPDRMVLGHRLAPVRHREGGIDALRLAEEIGRGVVFEVVELGEPGEKRRLRGRAKGL